MNSERPSLSRRKLLLSSAVACGSAALPALTPVIARASTPPSVHDFVPQNTEHQRFWSAQYWASKGDVKLALYRKRSAAPRSGAPALPVLFFAHGSSLSARSSFDLSVPGHGEYSMMNVFAAAGFDTWTMDFEGYGRSSVTSGNSDIKSGVADLVAALPVLERETGQNRFHFYGESSGALRVGAFAMLQPERVGRLVLGALTYTGQGSPTLTKRAEQADFYRTHNRRPRDRDMILSIFTRDKPGTSDPAAAQALVEAELPYGDSVPTGTYLDMSVNLPLVQPQQVLAPTLLVRGEYDGIATVADLLDFYAKLPNADRQISIIPNAAHAISMCYNRQILWQIALAFLTQPAAEPLHNV